MQKYNYKKTVQEKYGLCIDDFEDMKGVYIEIKYNPTKINRGLSISHTR